MIYYEIIVNWCKYCINKDCKFYNEPPNCIESFGR